MSLIGAEREDITLVSVQSAADRVASDVNVIVQELPGTLTSRAPDGSDYKTYVTEQHSGPRAALNALRGMLYRDMPPEADCVWWRIKPEVHNDPETDTWRARARLRFGVKPDVPEQSPHTSTAQMRRLVEYQHAVGTIGDVAPGVLKGPDWPEISGSLRPDKAIYSDTDFADVPRTLGEVRADKTRKANDWSPRDMLVQLLREIDSGTVATEHMVIAMRVPADDGKPGFQTDARRAGGDALIALGLLAMAGSIITDPE
jgi:hypothetical protein